MPHKLRKIRKTRGSRTQGYGRIGQHRDSGTKGARKVGRHKHLWSLVVTSEPNYFGKHGFTSPQSLHTNENAINLVKLDQLATRLRNQPDRTWLHQTSRHRKNNQTPNHTSSILLKNRPRKNKTSRRKNHNLPNQRRVKLLNGRKIPQPLQTNRKSSA